MGPNGHNVAVLKGGHINLGKDGVTVGNFSHYTDTAVDNLVSILAREAQMRQLERVGDGTSSTALLLRAMYDALVSSGLRPAQVVSNRPWLETRLRNLWGDIVTETPLTYEAIYRLAMVASHGDAELSNVVAKAQLKAGKDGLIYGMSPAEAYADEDQILAFDGLTLPRGLAVRGFANNKPGQRQGFHVDGPCYWVLSQVMVDDERGVAEVFKHINRVDKEAGRDTAATPIIFVAPVIGDKAMAKIAAQARQTTGHPDHREVGVIMIGEDRGEGSLNQLIQDMIEDLADVINPEGFYFSSRKNRFFADISRLAKDHNPISLTTGKVSVYMGARGAGGSYTEVALTDKSRKRAEAKANKLRAEAELEEQSGDVGLAKLLRSRAASLISEFPRVLLRKGTASEMDARHQLLDDAIRTVQSAVREGYVRGQGCAVTELALTLGESISDLPEDKAKLAEAVALALLALREHVIRLTAGEDARDKYAEVAARLLSEGIIPQNRDNIATGVIYDTNGNGDKDSEVVDSAAVGINAALTALETAAKLFDTAYVLSIEE